MADPRPAPPRPARSFGRNLLWVGAGNWIEQATQLAVFVLFARTLGKEAFGIMAMASAIVLFSEFLVRESLSDYVISSDDIAVARLDTVFWSLVALGAGLCAVVILAARPMSDLYGEPAVQGVMLALAPTPLIVALGAVPVALLRRDMQFPRLSVRAVAGALGGGGIGLALMANGAGVWSLVGHRLGQVAINALLAWASVPWRPGRRATLLEARGMATFSRDVLALRAAELATIQLPAVLIGIVGGAATLGVFAVAWRMIEIAAFLVVTPLRLVSQPAFAALRRGQGDLAARLLGVSRMSGFIAFPVFSGLAATSGPFVAVTLGPDWAAAAPVLSVIALGGCVSSIVKIDVAFCLACGRPGAMALLGWGEAALACLLLFALSPGGLVAMTAGLALALWVVWPLRLWAVARGTALGVRDVARAHVAPALAALVMSSCIWSLLRALPHWAAAPRLALAGLLGVLLYLALARVFMPDRLALLLARRPAAPVISAHPMPEDPS